jgi:SAM-dependent methyltransferase
MIQPTAIGYVGKVPTLVVTAANPEASKYKRLWGEFPQYREVSPGEQVAHAFLEQAKPARNELVIDFGCGTGRGALMLALPPPAGASLRVIMVDFANNALDPEIREALDTQNGRLQFLQHDLEAPLPAKATAKYGYCCDVMEHIPTERVDVVLDNILRAAQRVFFQISTVDDVCGALIGEPLHLTVRPHAWWLTKLGEHGCQVLWSAETENAALFYVTSWDDASELVKRGKVNTEAEIVREHVRAAVARNLPQCVPHGRQDTEVMLLAGGPSLADHWPQIIAKRKRGALLATVNGTYNEALEHGINPSCQIIIDARQFNARFVVPHVPQCHYFISSQCHPAVFDAAPKDQTLLWHMGREPELVKIRDEHYGPRGESWFPVWGGSTVTLRAFCLLRMLGFWRFQVYGFDSCLMGDKHHAYAQPENDADPVVKVLCGERVFHCTPWHVSQAHEFQDQAKAMGDEVEMVVHGDGLIAHILKTGAELADLDDK